MCSWISCTQKRSIVVPSLREIQDILVRIGDKPASFAGSREWIGALEVFYVIDTLYDISCRIQHIPRCEDIKRYTSIVKKHFEEFGGVVMMGGDLDCASKGICGVHIDGNDAYFLIMVRIHLYSLFLKC